MESSLASSSRFVDINCQGEIDYWVIYCYTNGDYQSMRVSCVKFFVSNLNAWFDMGNPVVIIWFIYQESIIHLKTKPGERKLKLLCL